MSADTTAELLPRWDVSDVFPSLDSREFRAAMEAHDADVARLLALFDEHQIGAVAPAPPTPADGVAADEVVAAYNRVAERADLLSTYVGATVTTDSRDELAQSLTTRLEATGAVLRPLLARLSSWIAALGVGRLAAVSEAAAAHAGPFAKLAERAAHQMPQPEEGLYAELHLTGAQAWDRLHADVTSQLTGTVVHPDGSTKVLAMPAIRGLASHADPAMRKAAFDAELTAWPTVAVVCAAAMNGVKGEACVVNRRRSWADPVDASLFANSVSRASFQAMQDAITATLPDLWRWMRIKAGLHGHDGGLPWWDLVAPLPHAAATVSWADGLHAVREAFGTYHPRLAALVDRAVAERWIDAEPRDGKVGGAFCAGLTGDRSLILLNWSGSADSTQTTAHELGHAYHNTQLAGRTPLQQALPMTLAETASIFCETLVVEDGLARLGGAERLALLDVDLAGTNQVLVDIRSRFLFEREVYARRERSTLGVTELNELMLDAQRAAYGDGLDHSTAHPYMWAVKGHYYGASFYNWPYSFGLLFGLGLYAAYRNDPEPFTQVYDEALSSVGMESAESIAMRFGYDITDATFWVNSLDVVRDRIDQYAALAAAEAGA